MSNLSLHHNEAFLYVLLFGELCILQIMKDGIDNYISVQSWQLFNYDVLGWPCILFKWYVRPSYLFNRTNNIHDNFSLTKIKHFMYNVPDYSVLICESWYFTCEKYLHYYIISPTLAVWGHKTQFYLRHFYWCALYQARKVNGCVFVC